MDNLQSPSAPYVSYLHSSYEDIDNHYGFTKLEKAALMIAQGHITNFAGNGNGLPSDAFLKAFSSKCVAVAKAVLEESNK